MHCFSLHFSSTVFSRLLVAGFLLRLPRFEPRPRSCGICGWQNGGGVGFPCQFSFHGLLYAHRLPSGAGVIGQIVTCVPSGLSLTQPKIKKKRCLVYKKVYLYLICYWSALFCPFVAGKWGHVYGTPGQYFGISEANDWSAWQRKEGKWSCSYFRIILDIVCSVQKTEALSAAFRGPFIFMIIFLLFYSWY